MKNTIYFLVYQAGLANVFSVDTSAKNREDGQKRILQSDFRTCETFCRGLRYAGLVVNPAWCNMAGDIAGQKWELGHFDNAPFNKSFASDFVTKEMRE